MSSRSGSLLRLFSRLKLYWSMVRFGLAHNRDFAVEHYEFFQGLVRNMTAKGLDLHGWRVLDVGCGKTFWLTLLLHSYGARVTGFDVEPPTPKITIKSALEIRRKQGLERAMRTAAWAGLFAGPYYRELARLSSFPLRFEGLDLRAMSVTALDFPDNFFDLIVSHEVFEHLPNVPAALAEIRRVLKPDGLTYIYVHNYTSLSGGHHLAWKYPDLEPSKTVPPWDHLRQNCFPEIPSWINKIRVHDYRRFFESEFAILEWIPGNYEGRALLTPDIRMELSAYSEEELILKGFVVLARPKKTDTGNCR